MDTFITGYISGVISALAVYVFIQSVRRGKGSASGSLKKRTHTNNTDTRSGIEKLKDNNRESGKIIDIATGEARRGLEAIDNTEKAVSDIIKAAKRKRRKDD